MAIIFYFILCNLYNCSSLGTTEVNKVFCNCIVKILHNTKYKCLKLAILVNHCLFYWKPEYDM